MRRASQIPDFLKCKRLLEPLPSAAVAAAGPGARDWRRSSRGSILLSNYALHSEELCAQRAKTHQPLN